MHGLGFKEFRQNEEVYKGEYANGLQHGYGCLSWREDTIHKEGNWINGKIHGEAAVIFSNG